ncbi:MAG: uroporphyrinogen decarboxylase, partial [Deltaproteobacteria bacterium]|nr:uroporphyrinogen decarboxylase [Deltaproteobacteria bacterium]
MTDNAAAYKAREKRFYDCIAFNKIDRVPVVPFVEAFPIRHYGVKMSDALGDYSLLNEIYYRFHDEFQPDVGDNPYALFGFFKIFEILDFKLLKWAGHGLGQDSAYQFVETEMMLPEQYDWFLSDPSDFMFRHILPNSYGRLAPLAKLPPISGSYYLFTPFIWAALADPAFADAGAALKEAASESTRALAAMGDYLAKVAEMGYPMTLGSLTQAPMDVVGDYLRGIKGMLVDLRRRPEKLLKASEALLPTMLKLGVSGCRLSKVPVCFIPLHKCMDNFMSQEQFEKFYWPTLLELIRGLVAEKIHPYLLIEGVCDNRLPVMIRDAPPGMCIYHLEGSDIFKAKKMARDKVCLRGNV